MSSSLSILQGDRITFAAVTNTDFDALAELRIAAMRESLERVGRFDPERARERLRNSFDPEHTQVILVDGACVGFYSLRPVDDKLHLDHLYVHPDFQSQGIGSHVMKRLMAEADARELSMYLGALRESASNRFYQRHGFVKTREDEWDIYYVRDAGIHLRERVTDDMGIEIVAGGSISDAQADFIAQWSAEYFGQVTAGKGMKKATVDWCFFLIANGERVSHAALSQLRVTVGGQHMNSGAMGGLFTVRAHIGKGYANLLMDRVEFFIQGELKADLGLLFCLGSLVPFYEQRGWSRVETPVTIEQPTGVVTWPESVMVLPFSGQSLHELPVHVPNQDRR